VLNAIGWGLVLPALALPVRLAAKQQIRVFPAGPIRLRRELERGLGGGASLIVTRDWECRFFANREGARIEGRQVDVSVMAPPALAALAEIERKREVSGLFPLKLDRGGAIVGWPSGEANVARAVERAAREIDKKAVEQSAQADAKRYVAEIGRTAAELVSQVPRDLFYPQTGKRTETRSLDLPGGEKGSYEITIFAKSRRSDGLLETSERRIVTRIGGSARVSRETWTIA
jgi:hypothetical protein